MGVDRCRTRPGRRRAGSRAGAAMRPPGRRNSSTGVGGHRRTSAPASRTRLARLSTVEGPPVNGWPRTGPVHRTPGDARETGDPGGARTVRRHVLTRPHVAGRRRARGDGAVGEGHGGGRGRHGPKATDGVRQFSRSRSRTAGYRRSVDAKSENYVNQSSYCVQFASCCILVTIPQTGRPTDGVHLRSPPHPLRRAAPLTSRAPRRTTPRATPRPHPHRRVTRDGCRGAHPAVSTETKTP